ncbi:D-xylose ABC transporter substrate-binding protein [Neobacillus cucumis]|uniref:D-xylose ABC transporter substrate-binding protein n=1 Tax=Neobacillus cucumis TaxID=1740721 RepID=UPI002E1EBCE8|nr:D-xylose ABC transporter substrate-binding protein [Neobacillus cucumis]MED4226305.1 D-xylose ABC transporter substrate-binding protein [Neobacillus cucumis]
MKKWKGFLSSFLVVFLVVMLAACSAGGQDVSKNASGNSTGGKNGKLKIGLSVGDLTLERWQHDRDIFVKEAKKQGADVLVQSADGDAAKQLSQIQNMLSQGINALVIISVNSDSLSPVVEQAKKQGIPVVAYDRLINNADVDAYVSFDNVKVGEMQAEAIVKQVPKGNYFLLGGSPTDNNAKLFRQGQMNVLKPLIDKGDIKVVGDQWAKNWDANEAMKLIENGLTANHNKVDAIVASNDSTASGTIQALAEQHLDGKVAVSGQDADLDAVQHIVEGTQTMTVYKPIQLLATKSADVAVQLAKGEKVTGDSTINNGKVNVPYIMLTPIAVTKDNVMDTIVKDGFHTYDEVYKNVPANERPAKK